MPTVATVNATFANPWQKGEEMTVPVLNPGAWFGQTWLVEIGGSYWPRFAIVEAENYQEAVEVVAETDGWKHELEIFPEDLADYQTGTDSEGNPEYRCHWSDSGVPLDLEHLLIHGDSETRRSFPCRYFGDDLPTDGIEPATFGDDE